jgi:hypothetical protein
MQSTLRKIEWRAIEGYDNHEVSDTGLVRNKGTRRILRPCINKRGYGWVNLCREGTKPRAWCVHRLVAIAFIPNPDNKPFVDHIDRDKRNNHVSNLRWATKQENGMNMGKRSDNTSGYKGVTFDKSCGKWRSQIQKDGKRFRLGRFKSLEDAAAAYDQAAAEMFGEFACINPAKPKIPVQISLKAKS